MEDNVWTAMAEEIHLYSLAGMSRPEAEITCFISLLVFIALIFKAYKKSTENWNDTYWFWSAWAWIMPCPVIILLLQTIMFLTCGLFPYHEVICECYTVCIVSGLMLCSYILNLEFVFPSPLKRYATLNYQIRFRNFICFIDLTSCLLAVILPAMPIVLLTFNCNIVPLEDGDDFLIITAWSIIEIVFRLTYVLYHITKHNCIRNRHARVTKYYEIVDCHQKEYNELVVLLISNKNRLHIYEKEIKDLEKDIKLTLLSRQTKYHDSIQQFNELSRKHQKLHKDIKKLENDISIYNKRIKRYKRLGFKQSEFSRQIVYTGNTTLSFGNDAS